MAAYHIGDHIGWGRSSFLYIKIETSIGYQSIQHRKRSNVAAKQLKSKTISPWNTMAIITDTSIEWLLFFSMDFAFSPNEVDEREKQIHKIYYLV